jgi:hypothetical protein
VELAAIIAYLFNYKHEGLEKKWIQYVTCIKDHPTIELPKKPWTEDESRGKSHPSFPKWYRIDYENTCNFLFHGIENVLCVKWYSNLCFLFHKINKEWFDPTEMNKLHCLSWIECDKHTISTSLDLFLIYESIKKSPTGIEHHASSSIYLPTKMTIMMILLECSGLRIRIQDFVLWQHSWNHSSAFMNVLILSTIL